MQRFELTINPGYVPDWSYWEGLREITQNVLDQERIDPIKYEKFITYNSQTSVLLIGNTNSFLDKSSLLLGSTTKSDSKFIGKWGEGYKLALLVLCRLGIRIKIFNINEVWEPKIINSKRYKSEILVIDISSSKATSNLHFELTGITPSVYSEFALNFLGIDYPLNIKTSPIGNILLDPKFKKKLYVGGLFVQDVVSENMNFGYDIAPENLSLDRDRRKVENFNLFWQTSRIFVHLAEKEMPFVRDCINNNYPELQSFNFHSNQNSKYYKDIAELNYKDFLLKHGKNAVPVSSQKELEYIQSKYNSLVPVIVLDAQKEFYERSASFISSGKLSIKKEKTPNSFLQDFLKKNKNKIFGSVKQLIINEIVSESKLWQYRPGLNDNNFF